MKKLFALTLLVLLAKTAEAQDIPVAYASSVLKYDSSAQCSFRSPTVTTFQGNTGGMTIVGGTASGDDLTLSSTSNGTKGTIFFGTSATSAYDQANGYLGIGDATPDTQFHFNGLSVDPPSPTWGDGVAYDTSAYFKNTFDNTGPSPVIGAGFDTIFTAGSITTDKVVGLKTMVAGLGTANHPGDLIGLEAVSTTNSTSNDFGATAIRAHAFTGSADSGNTGLEGIRIDLEHLTAASTVVTATGVDIDINGNNPFGGAISTAYGTFISINGANANHIANAVGAYVINNTTSVDTHTAFWAAGAIAPTSIAFFNDSASAINKYVGKSTFGVNATPTAYVDIDGSGDDEQLHVKGHSTQTNNIVLVEKDDGTDLLAISNAGALTIVDDAYSASTWNGSATVPTKNAIRDKIETMFTETVKYKTAQQDLTSDNTLNNDADLVVAVAASTKYRVNGTVRFFSASGAPDAQMAFTVPTGTTMDIMVDTVRNGAAGDTAFLNTSGTGTGLLVIGAGGDAVVHFSGVIQVSTTAGNLQLQWAQNTSDGTATSMNRGSWMSILPFS